MRIYAFIASVAIVLIIIGLFLVPVMSYSEKTADFERVRSELTTIIGRTLTQCYALEGSYPPSLEYLEETYGLVLDHDRYTYVYEPSGMSNIKPDFDILPNKWERWYGR